MTTETLEKSLKIGTNSVFRTPNFFETFFDGKRQRHLSSLEVKKTIEQLIKVDQEITNGGKISHIEISVNLLLALFAEKSVLKKDIEHAKYQEDGSFLIYNIPFETRNGPRTFKLKVSDEKKVSSIIIVRN